MTRPSSPDPDRGLFETLLVAAGEPVELSAHLDRLAASLEELFGASPPPRLAGEVRERARGTSLGRLRITVTLASGAPRAELASEAVDPADFFPAWQRGAELRSLPYDGGLGAHKWADRRHLGETRGTTVPLLLDRGEEVLEAGRANIFAAFGETLFTPPADGRILPGIARAGAIAAARGAGIEVREERLTRERLRAADEVFLTGSVRGVEPVRALDGAPLAAATELSCRVGERLRRRWLGAGDGPAPPALAGAPPAGPLAR
jgi:para-aminobenzoate synthetase / 4-amino-4-deoxychorismate lyase